ncbi:Hypothetical predicted protein, partial [Paramuricea clavata]
KQDDGSNTDYRLLYFKINSSLSNINPDGNGLYWCLGQDRLLRSHLGLGVKYVYCFNFDKIDSNAVLHVALLLISGDVATNPGPTQTASADISFQSCSSQNIGQIWQVKNLSVLYANARSIVNKTDKLCLEIHSGQFDIVVLTETHLDNTIVDSEIFPPNFIVFRRDRQHLGRHGGGVLIGTKNTLKVHHRDDITCIAEILFVDILLHRNKKLTIGVFYRPPNREWQPFEELNQILSEISTSDIILLGDFNISDINWNNISPQRDSLLENLLIDIVHEHFFSQLVNEPTRGSNILDLVLTTSTDHIQDVQKADWDSLRNLLLHAPWELSLADNNTNVCWQTWKDLFLAAVDDCMPKANVAKNKQNAPWITRELISLFKRKCNLARQSYVDDLIEELKVNNTKPFWKYVNSKRKDETYDNFPTVNRILNEELTDVQCTIEEVERHLKTLNVCKSSGPDNIPPRILKECASQLAPSLAINPFPRIAEKIVRDRSVKFWLSRKVFNENQFGYLKNKSTLSQLLLCYNDWAKTRNDTKATDVVFMDFSKAFDSVPHERLLYKLEQH